MKQLFVITKRSPRPVNSLTTPAAASTRGVAMQESAGASVAELADGTNPLAAFLARNPRVGCPVLRDVVSPGGLELLVERSGPGSFEMAEEFEAEGTPHIERRRTAATRLKAALTFAED